MFNYGIQNHVLKSVLLSLTLAVTLTTMVAAYPAKYSQSPANAKVQTGSLTIVAVGIKNNTGMLRVGLFNSPAAYGDMQHPSAPLTFRSGSAPIIKLKSKITFTRVPYGVYAIKLFQDEFMTGQLKRSWVGKPLEGVGISNNPQIKTRLPAWDLAKFTINKPATTVVIRMQNF